MTRKYTIIGPLMLSVLSELHVRPSKPVREWLIWRAS